MERPELKKVSPAVVSYIEYLENIISGSDALANEISLFKAGLAADMEMIRNNVAGEEYANLKYMSADDKSPKGRMLSTWLKMVDQFDKQPKKIGRPPKETKEEDIEPDPQEEEKPQQSEGGVTVNIFEATRRKVMKK